VALIGGLIGARAYYLLQNHDDVSFGDVFSGSGLIWYGGLIGGIIAVVLWAKRRDFLTLTLFDFGGFGLPLGYAIGRIGCQVSGDGDYGKDWDGPWAMGYPHGEVPTAPGQTVHPTPIYETLTMGLLAFCLWQLRDRVRPGVLFGIYLVAAGVERFLVEFLRRNAHALGGLTGPQLESLVMIAVGVAGLAWAWRGAGGLGLRPVAAPAARTAR